MAVAAWRGTFSIQKITTKENCWIIADCIEEVIWIMELKCFMSLYGKRNSSHNYKKRFFLNLGLTKLWLHDLWKRIKCVQSTTDNSGLSFLFVVLFIFISCCWLSLLLRRSRLLGEKCRSRGHWRQHDSKLLPCSTSRKEKWLNL